MLRIFAAESGFLAATDPLCCSRAANQYRFKPGNKSVNEYHKRVNIIEF
jgi:hypothetical protein